jgi:hypothetical protein
MLSSAERGVGVWPPAQPCHQLFVLGLGAVLLLFETLQDDVWI